MKKTLLVFDPDQVFYADQEPDEPTVFRPDDRDLALAVVSPPDHQQETAVFCPPLMNDDSTTVFDFSISKPIDKIPVFCPSVFGPVNEQQAKQAFTVVFAAREPPKRQGQREIDKVIRKFLKQIKAQNIRIRRVGHTTYSWKHPIDPEPGDTGSDVRWEIKLAASQIHMGVYDIKPFFRIVSGPFDVKKLIDVRKDILDEMDADAGE